MVGKSNIENNIIGLFVKLGIAICVFIFACIAGCQEDPLIEQLRRENPFRKPEVEKQPTQKWLEVSCDTLTFELPDTYDINQLRIFQNYRITGRDEKHINLAIMEGFKSKTLWHANGFIVSVAPRVLWNKTLEKFDVFFTDQVPQSKLRIFKTSGQYADLYLRSIIDTESIFIFDPGMIPHGYDLSDGESLFRIQCQPPVFSSSEPSSVYVSLAMMFKEQLPYTSNSVAGLYQRSQPEQIISFDYLALSGMLLNDNVIVITCDDESIKSSNAAGRLLYNQATNTRIIAVLAPNAKMIESN